MSLPPTCKVLSSCLYQLRDSSDRNLRRSIPLEILYSIKELRNKRAHAREITAREAKDLVELAMSFFQLANFPEIAN